MASSAYSTLIQTPRLGLSPKPCLPTPSIPCFSFLPLMLQHVCQSHKTWAVALSTHALDLVIHPTIHSPTAETLATVLQRPSGCLSRQRCYNHSLGSQTSSTSIHRLRGARITKRSDITSFGVSRCCTPFHTRRPGSNLLYEVWAPLSGISLVNYHSEAAYRPSAITTFCDCDVGTAELFCRQNLRRDNALIVVVDKTTASNLPSSSSLPAEWHP